MNANATAISLNLDQVKLILQDWLIATTVGFSEAVIFRIIKEHAEATHAA